jgi:uncharacterized protein YcbX
MEENIAGSVSRLWRYPIKSMLGEELDSADVIWCGFHGNRCYALVDVQSSRLVSAKNPAKWARMFECSSRLMDGDLTREGPPPVLVALPDGKSFDISEGEYGVAEASLSELLGRSVRFIAADPEPRVSILEQYHPEIEEDPNGGRITEFHRPADAQAGTYTDLAAVHLITTASLNALAHLHPSGNPEPERFRPNVLVDTGVAKGFVEVDWIGKTLAIGDEVRMNVYKECGRCVMTTLPQGKLSADTGILRAIMHFNRGKFGVLASVLKGGKIRTHDKIRIV